MASIVWISYTTRGWYLLANVNCISFVSKSINLTEILSIFLSHILQIYEIYESLFFLF